MKIQSKVAKQAKPMTWSHLLNLPTKYSSLQEERKAFSTIPILFSQKFRQLSIFWCAPIK